jgi:2-polyprenyl-3-methyl-5-hydroxy-6-metoxy-1,4-benzoquinol methylase
MARISNQRAALNEAEVKAFFEQRGSSINPEHALTSILYQDNHPELAEQRDRLEKSIILPQLGVRSDDEVLDIGCGIGRWAGALADKVQSYHGIDFSANLIAYARQSFRQQTHVTFQEMAAQDVHSGCFDPGTGFTLVIISGVLIYINDEDCARTLANVAGLCRDSARIYIREPIGLETRLTLVDFYSEELQAKYNAIYRTHDELWDMFQQTLLARGFRCRQDDFLYPAEMNNRKETRQKYYIFSR